MRNACFSSRSVNVSVFHSFTAFCSSFITACAPIGEALWAVKELLKALEKGQCDELRIWLIGDIERCEVKYKLIVSGNLYQFIIIIKLHLSNALFVHNCLKAIHS